MDVDDTALRIIRNHCLPDEKEEYILLSIFKDADALDRVRFADVQSALNPKYLRTTEAKRLVGFARMLLSQITEVAKDPEYYSDPCGYVDLSLNDW